MTPSSRWISSALLICLGCSGGLVSIGPPVESELNSVAATNGVVVVSNAEVWAEAADQLTDALVDMYPTGVEPNSPLQVTLPSTIQGAFADPMISWSSLQIAAQGITLDVGPTGLELSISSLTDLEDLEVKSGDEVLCSLPSGQYATTLVGRLTLSQSKLGLVQVSPAAGAALHFEMEIPELLSCNAALVGDMLDSTTLDPVVKQTLGDALFTTLGPVFNDILPPALGVDRSATWTWSAGESGEVTTTIRPPRHPEVVWWQYSQDQLVVPFAVSTEVMPDPCVEASAMPLAMSAAVPETHGQNGVLISQAVATRLLYGFWQAGGLCGTRLSRELAWSPADLEALWPAAVVAAAEANVQVILWPEQRPIVTIGDITEDTSAGATLSGLRWTMELMGWFDGAMVRLGTLTAEVDISARFKVGSGGGVSLQTTGVEVISVHATGGLLAPAADTEADRLAAAFAAELVDSIPLWTLPKVGDFAPTEAKFIAPYLMFTDG